MASDAASTPAPTRTSESARAGRPSRRRQRSVRLIVAAILLGVAAAVVLAAIASGSPTAVATVAVVAVVLGAAATKITHTELVETRREAAADRARQAQDYRRITEKRAGEHAAFVKTMKRRIADREETIRQVRAELGISEAKTTEAVRARQVAEKEASRLGRELRVTRDRAEHAQLRVVELEQELTALRAELESVTAAWRAADARRAHA